MTQKETKYSLFVGGLTVDYKGFVTAKSEKAAIKQAENKGIVDRDGSDSQFLVIESDKIEAFPGEKYEKYYGNTFF